MKNTDAPLWWIQLTQLLQEEKLIRKKIKKYMVLRRLSDVQKSLENLKIIMQKIDLARSQGKL